MKLEVVFDPVLTQALVAALGLFGFLLLIHLVLAAETLFYRIHSYFTQAKQLNTLERILDEAKRLRSGKEE